MTLLYAVGLAIDIMTNRNVSEGMLAGLFAGATAIAWRVAYVGVRNARCGDVPDWQWLFRPLRRLADWLPRRWQPFASAARDAGVVRVA